MMFFCPAIQRIFEGTNTLQDLEDLENAIRACDALLEQIQGSRTNPQVYLDAVMAIHRVKDLTAPRISPENLDAENANPLHMDYGFAPTVNHKVQDQ